MNRVTLGGAFAAVIAGLLTVFSPLPARAQEAAKPVPVVLFTNVRIFNGKDAALSAPSNVLIRGNKIEKISAAPIPTDKSANTILIDGGGRTLMPGLIDAHTHLVFAEVPQQAALLGDIGFIHIAAGKAAEHMLLRGFTTARDLGGPSFGLKQAIDVGLIIGPRIYPSGAFISQSGGHGDFRLPNDIPKDLSAPLHYTERVGAAAIADNPDEVRLRAREQLMKGASQVKLMAGGGVSSNYDPLDVTQYTVPELRAAVEAAENWGTYVTVHAYTPRAVRQAIEAGVKCIDHGQLLDDATVKLMADKGIWWSLQPFIEDPEKPSAFPEGSPNRIKQQEMFGGTDNAYKLAKKYKVKTAWGTDNLFSAANAAQQTRELSKMVRWYTPAEALKMATADNAELLTLSGPRNPYPGKLGVVEEGALADLLLVDGDPIANIKLIEDPAKNFLVIMKDGKIYKNAMNGSGAIGMENGKTEETGIKGAYLQPTELMGVAAPDYPGTRKLYLHLTEDGKAQGFSGVNRFTGTYTTSADNALKFGQMASTRMAGPPATMQVEDSFLKVLTATTHYRKDGDKVEFLAGDKVIARFKTVPAP